MLRRHHGPQKVYFAASEIQLRLADLFSALRRDNLIRPLKYDFEQIRWDCPALQFLLGVRRKPESHGGPSLVITSASLEASLVTLEALYVSPKASCHEDSLAQST